MTDVTAVATTALAANATQPTDPILQGLLWLIAVVVALLAIGKPLRDYVRGERRDSKADTVNDAKSDAEASLYTHLSQQVSQYRQIADSAFQQNNELVHRVAQLEASERDHQRTAEIVNKLKIKLDEKDRQIQKLLDAGEEDRRQFFRVLETKEEQIARLERRQRELEDRLIKDENASVFHCPLTAPTGEPLTFTHDSTCTPEVCDEPNA